MVDSQTARRRPGPRAGSSSSKQTTVKRELVKFTDEELLLANKELALAFQILGCIDGSTPKCPACGATNKKVVLKSSGSGHPYWKCFKCSTYGSATKALQDYGGMKFPDAVNTLLGRPTGSSTVAVDTSKIKHIEIEPAFKAVTDPDVYDFIRNRGSVEAAAEYYKAVAHISPEVVAESGSTYLTNCAAIGRDLIKEFGKERLIASGIFMLDKNKKELFLFSDTYCVIEPHERACVDLRASWRSYLSEKKLAEDEKREVPEPPFRPPTCTRSAEDGHGHIVGMQFRPSLAQKRKIDAHKAWKKRWSGLVDPETNEPIEPSEAWAAMREVSPEAAGEKVPYISPFLGIRGATPESLVGCGLRRISTLNPGENIKVVEGFKDVLAERTMGFEAYGIPGTGVMPGDHICELLSRHLMIVGLDGDEAGRAGRDKLIEHFESKRVYAEPNPDIIEGMDSADRLIDSYAKKGCGCETCVAWRARK